MAYSKTNWQDNVTPVSATNMNKIEQGIFDAHNLIATHKHIELAPVITPTFSRSSVAYKSDGTQVAVGVPRFEPGKFGQAVMVEEGTTNLLTANQSSVETDTSGFLSVGSTILRDTSKAWNGTASLKVVTSGSSGFEGFRTTDIAVSPSTTYTFSVYLTGSGTVRLTVYYYDSGGAYISNTTGSAVTLDSSWKREALTFTTPSNAAKVRLLVETPGVTQAITFWVDGLQLEQKPYATSWVLGGTTRAAETLTIPAAGIWNKGNWQIDLVWQPTVDTSKYNYFGRILNVWIDDNNRYEILVDPTTGRVYGTVCANGTYQNVGRSGGPIAIPGNWYTFSLRGNGTNLAFFANGLKIEECTYTEPVGAPTTINLAVYGNGTSRTNGLFGCLRISNIARSDAEIAAAYASGKPLPWDEYTTALFTFDGRLDTGPRVGQYRLVDDTLCQIWMGV